MGYSAQVDGFLVIGDKRLRIAKSNGMFITLAEPVSDLMLGGRATLEITIDGNTTAESIYAGAVAPGHNVVEYTRLPEGV